MSGQFYISIPPKTSENQWFFRGYRKGALAWNKLYIFFFLDEVHVTIILSITTEPMITKDLQFRGRCNDNVENNQDTGLLQLIYHQKNIQNPVKHLKWSV